MTVTRYKQGRFWAVLDREGRLVCVCVYRKGAEEVRKRLIGADVDEEGRGAP